MQAWLASLGALLIAKLVEKIPQLALMVWNALTKEAQEKLAEKRIKEHISKVMKQYEELVLKYDDIVDSKGELTEEEKEKLRLEKIKLEENMFNSIGKP